MRNVVKKYVPAVFFAGLGVFSIYFSGEFLLEAIINTPFKLIFQLILHLFVLGGGVIWLMISLFCLGAGALLAFPDYLSELDRKARAAREVRNTRQDLDEMSADYGYIGEKPERE